MEWKQRNPSATTIEQVLVNTTGVPIEQLLHPKKSPYIHNLSLLAEFVKQAVSENKKIFIYGDYDGDGVCGSAILYRMLVHGLHYTNVKVRLPGRATTGYGFQTPAAEEMIEKGCEVLITVDNGISANEAIQFVKDAGIQVAVIDHHPSLTGILPCADVLVDPNADGGMSEYKDYCGAGLAYRLAEELGLQDLKGIKELACIATVTDVMNLIGDNRNIVRDGLEMINHNRSETLSGLQTLLEKTGLVYVDVDDIGFTIGPIINAADRMGAGAKLPLQLFIQDLPNTELVERMIRINEDRKTQTKNDMLRIHQKIEDDCLFGECPLFVAFTEEGGPLDSINGILAGRLVEEYHIPAFVMSLNPKDGLLHGSGRSVEGIDIKAALDSASECFVRYGGHPMAAGITIHPDRVYEASAKLQEYMSHVSMPEQTSSFYDLEIDARDISEMLEKLEAYKPFGTGCPAPVFKVKGFRLIPNNGVFYKAMNSDTIKLLGEHAAGLGFSMLSKFQDDGEPKLVTLYGTLKINRYMGYRGLIAEEQVEFQDFERCYEKKVSSLRSALLSGLASV